MIIVNFVEDRFEITNRTHVCNEIIICSIIVRS